MKWPKFLAIALAFCTMLTVSAQKSGNDSPKMLTISGKVVNSSGTAIAGAVFYIDNVRTSYVSKADGSYRIKVYSGATKLKVQSSEYGSAEETINGQKKIIFTLNNGNPENEISDSGKPDLKSRQDAGQNAGNKRARKMNTYNDIYQMIRGELSGVLVNGRSIIIQQQNSFFGSTEPLFVVNGVIVNSIDFVNPLEVKSIQLLTGSSAAIYGIRGANGVISITLLNGSEEAK